MQISKKKNSRYVDPNDKYSKQYLESLHKNSQTIIFVSVQYIITP